MDQNHCDIRQFSQLVLREVSAADLINVTVRVFTSLKKVVTIPDIMTEIRIITGVAICRQASPVKRSKKGRDVVDLDVRYYPKHMELADYLETLGRLIKNGLFAFSFI